MLVIALPKGRLLEPSLAALAAANICFAEDVAASRKLIFDSEDGRFRVFLVKPVDVPTYVEYGAADLGIAGRDVILESGADLLQPLALNFGFCRIAVAGLKDRSELPQRTLRVATKYPRLTLDYYNARGIPVEIIPLSGSIELAPLIGLADRIVDVVETGRTLKENGLDILETVTETSARLVINRAGYQTKRAEMRSLIQALEKVVQCESSI